MSSKDLHGDRMKYYEELETSRKLMKGLPIYARLDGHGFSKFTKPFVYPYDRNLRQVFNEVCTHLIEKFGVKLAYHQSDEISLLFYREDQYGGVNTDDILFGGKIQKLASILAASATSKFISSALRLMPEHTDHILNNCPEFDCRIFSIPSLTEAINQFVWRERDCTKNSVSMLARHHFSHKSLQGKNRNQMLDMLVGAGDNWNDWNSAFKRGTYLAKRTIEKETLDGVVTRNIVQVLDVPPITRITNKKEVLIDGLEPVFKDSTGDENESSYAC